MPESGADRTHAHDTLAAVARAEHGRLLSVLMRQTGDLEAAEDALQDAFARALSDWPAHGPPASPAAWLLTVARRRAADRHRRTRRVRSSPERLDDLVALTPDDSKMDSDSATIADERLRLIFTCCHPALAPEARIALTLNTVCGLTATQVARGFLVADETMAQRLVRAKRKIRHAGIPYEVPEGDELAERSDAVHSVVYLTFNAGYTATRGDALIDRDLCDEAIRLGRLLVSLTGQATEAAGLLSLMLFQHSRRAARADAQGRLLRLDEQDRTLWDRQAIAEGSEVLARAAGLRPAGPYVLQAAIAGIHASSPRPADTDWRRIVRLYDDLMEQVPSAVVCLNRAVAVAHADGPAAGLALIDALASQAVLDDYPYFHAARADCLERLGRQAEASTAWQVAARLTSNVAERNYLEGRGDRSRPPAGQL